MNDPAKSRPGKRHARIAAACIAACLLWLPTACGQRGPLYLPDGENGGNPPPAQEEKQDEEDDGATTGA